MSVTAPLAHRLRPITLEDFVGQQDIVGPGSPLRRAIEEDRVGSVILAGPPGTGKTTLARIIAEATSAQFVQLNAVVSGVKELKTVCEEAKKMSESFHQRTVLFIDEIHRFNTSQQDALLPYVESGAVILIGATTQNPYFDVNQALVSRSHVYLLKPLSVEHLVQVLKRALVSSDGFAGKVEVSDEALLHIASIANGDARIALNSLELAALTMGGKIDAKAADAILREKGKRYDGRGDVVCDAASPATIAEEFVAQIAVISHPTVIAKGYTPVFHVHTAQVPCQFIELIEKTGADGVNTKNPDFLKNGDLAKVRIKPIGNLVLETQAKNPKMAQFAIRDAGATVAAGVCIEITPKKI
jgi:Holliday junction resolvasome RuvABC ATP-dependent DNA helicase subunit